MTRNPEQAAPAGVGDNVVARYRSVLRSLGAGVVVQDLQGRVVECNAAAERILGLPAEVLVGGPPVGEGWLVTGDDGRSVDFGSHPAIVGLRKGRPLRDVTLSLHRPDGDDIWIMLNTEPLRGPGGSVDAVVSSFTDITPLRRAQDALASSEARYRLLAENASDLVFLSDTGGRLTWLSPSTADVLGWTHEELRGRMWTEAVHPDDVGVALRAHATVSEGGSASYRARFVTRDGGFRWAAVTARPVTDGSGVVVGFAGSARDVTDEVAAQQAAERESARAKAAMDAMLDPHMLLEPVRDPSGVIVDFVCVDVNEAVWRPSPLSRGDIVGIRALDAMPGLSSAGLFDRYAAVVETGEPLIADSVAFTYRGGSEVGLFDVRAVKVGDGLGVTYRDVTDRDAARAALEASEARYRLLAENASDVVWQMAPDGEIAWSSESVGRVLGWDPDDVVGHGMDLVHPEDVDRARRIRAQALSGVTSAGEVRFRTSDGAFRWMHLTSRPLPTPEGVARVVTLRDVHDEVTARSDLEHALGHDPLTGLATRAAILARLSASLERLGPFRSVGVIALAIDSLGEIVNALTHAAGDLVLTNVAARIVTALGDSDLVGRGSGNEFFVLVPALVSGTDAAGVAASLRAAVRGPVPVLGHRVDPTVSVGIATGGRGDDPERLLRDASLAMRQAKRAGRDREAFADPDLAAEAQTRIAVEARVRDALRNRDFVAWFQPVVALPSGEVTGYEALVRLTRDGTVQAPASFMHVAEASGLVADLDLLVLDHAAAVLARLPAPMTVAVNAAAATLGSPGYADQVLDVVRRHGADPGRLHIEVTETALLTVDEGVEGAIYSLAEAGIRWYVDDFGTGYSSISHLRDLPVAGLKLDRSFVAAAPRHARSRRLAAALAALAETLDLDTVAEGVETRGQAALLHEQGWRHAQGWLYGRPAPLDVVPSSAAVGIG